MGMPVVVAGTHRDETDCRADPVEEAGGVGGTPVVGHLHDPGADVVAAEQALLAGDLQISGQ